MLCGQGTVLAGTMRSTNAASEANSPSLHPCALLVAPRG